MAPRYVPGRVVVGIGSEFLGLAQVLADCGIYEYDGEIGALKVLRAVVPPDVSVKDMISRLLAHPEVMYAVQDEYVEFFGSYHPEIHDTFAAATGISPFGAVALEYDPEAGETQDVPDAPNYVMNWHHALLNFYRAWKIVNEVVTARRGPKPGGGDWRGDPDVNIVVVDTGIRSQEGDLDDPALFDPLNNYDAESQQFIHVPDMFGHGTLVAGIIAARHNGQGTAGGAPDCTLMSAKGAPNDGSDSPLYLMADAFVVGATMGTATPGKRAVLSVSWGGLMAGGAGTTADQQVLRMVVNAVRLRGALFVSAVGNEHVNVIHYPARADGALSVGALEPSGREYRRSNYGPLTDVVTASIIGAPVSVGTGLSQIPLYKYSDGTVNGSYWSGTGTSSATPLAASISGLVLSVNPALTADYPAWSALPPWSIAGTWTPAWRYGVNTYAVNDGGKVYVAINYGTSAASGGPTGTGADIVDGTVHWKYLDTWAGYVLRDRVSNGGLAYECIVAGVPDQGGPGPSGTGSDIVDGTVHWKYVGVNNEIGAVLRSTVSPFARDSINAIFPNAGGTLNGGKACTKARSMLPAPDGAGNLFPYVGFISTTWVDVANVRIPAGSYSDGWDATPGCTVLIQKDGAGKVRTFLRGSCMVELTAYGTKLDGSDDPVTRMVLTVGGVVVRDTDIHGTATSFWEDTSAWPTSGDVVVTAYSEAHPEGVSESCDDIVALPSEALPAVLHGADASERTADLAGETLTFDAGERAEWLVHADAGGSFDITAESAGAGTVEILLDGLVVKTIPVA
jgi:hypothetical protein